MCGVVGLWAESAQDLTPDYLTAMADRIRHRGPDDSGLWLDSQAGIGLAHRRLSILDLSSAGHQPMAAGDGRIQIVFNGEIYNFAEIAKELRSLGHEFKSRCDTEVLLRAYLQWGRAFLSRLVGMFAFALWDGRKSELWLVRDRSGKKPLYYYWDGDRRLFAFASEIKALFQHPAIRPRVDPLGVRSYLDHGYVAPPLTGFAGIRKLPAAHEMVVCRGQAPQVRQWWDLSDLAGRRIGKGEAKETIRHLVTQAVNRRLVSDVPVAVALSGGVDSTIVAALAARNCDGPLRTYSIAFDVADRSGKYNVDADVAEIVAARIGSRHKRLTIGKDLDFSHLVEQFVDAMDEPNYNGTGIALRLLTDGIHADGVKVVLSGDGGDELFTGYRRYLNDRILDYFQYLPKGIRDRLAPRVGDGLAARADLAAGSPERLFSWCQLFSQQEIDILVHDEVATAPSAGLAYLATLTERARRIGPGARSVDMMGYADYFFWLPEESNSRTDHMSMQSSVEWRAPLQDADLAQFAYSLPVDMKAGLRQEKLLLKQACADLLPHEVTHRPKWGFLTPYSWWLRHRLWNEAEEAIRELPHTPLFKASGVEHFIGSKTRVDLQKMWSLYILALWYRKYFSN